MWTSPCRFGQACTRPDCRFEHPHRALADSASSSRGRSSSSSRGFTGKGHGTTPVCRFGFNCDQPGCNFTHPHGRHIDNARAAGVLPPPLPSNAKGAVSKGSGHAGSQIICGHGFQCNLSDCHFSHPFGRHIDNAAAAGVPPPPLPPSGSSNAGGKGGGQTLCRYGLNCSSLHCNFLHPAGRHNFPEIASVPVFESSSAASSAGKGKGKSVTQPPLCRHGFDCNRTDCVFHHPNGRNIDNAHHFPASSNTAASRAVSPRAVSPRAVSPRAVSPRAVSPRAPSETLFLIQLEADVVQQLKDGMLYHLNRILRRQQLLGRLPEPPAEGHIEILRSQTHSAPSDVGDLETSIREELARLVSLRIVLTEEIPFSQSIAPRLLGPRGLICQMLCRDLGVQLQVHNCADRDPNGEAVLQVFGIPQAMEESRQLIYDHLFSFLSSPPRNALAEIQFAEESRQTVHLFVDNSNISIGCQFLPDGKRDFLQRLNVRGFTAAVAGARQVARKVVVGSKPPRTNRIWQIWENEGYNVLVEWRSPETNQEQFVDARLVGEALMHVVNSGLSGHPPGIVALCTGDGNLEGQADGTAGANFRQLANAVVRLGWRCEIWSWRTLCHSAYHRMARDPDLQGRLKVRSLDGLRNKVTFRALQEGSVVESVVATESTDDVEGSEVQDDPDFNLCVVCFSSERTHVFRPCGHSVICQECAEAMLPHRNRPPLGLCCYCRSQWTAIEAV